MNVIGRREFELVYVESYTEYKNSYEKNFSLKFIIDNASAKRFEENYNLRQQGK